MTVFSEDSTPAQERCLRSVRDQTLGEWEHLVVVSGAGARTVERFLAGAARDPRVKPIRQHPGVDPVELINVGSAAAAGRWLVVLEERDWLRPDALATVAGQLAGRPDAVLAYSDWAEVDGMGQVVRAFLKPDWSPERLRSHDYVSDLTIMSTDAVHRAGGYLPAMQGAHKHDLLLRLTEGGGEVVHIPQTICLRDAETGQTVSAAAWDATVTAVQDHSERIGLRAEVHRGPAPGTTRSERAPRRSHLVSIIIPTRGTQAEVFGRTRTMVVDAVESMMASSPDADVEFVVVADTAGDESYLRDLQSILGFRLVVVPYDRPFNFSEKCNLGAVHASGDVLVFANDDVEIITPRWLEQMTALAEESDVGLVGAFLKFEDGTVQHCGHVYEHGLPVHAHFRSVAGRGYFDDLVVDHEASGATAALVGCRAEVFDEVGGFCNDLPGSFNDVDFCLKIRSLGYRIVIAMTVEAWHFESKSRNPTASKWEIDYLQSRWNAMIQTERYMRGPGVHQR